MRISVAMCTYNGQQYLQQQLNSILNQSRQPDEVVVCDDASSDDTPRLLQAFAAQAPFAVHLVWNENNLGSTPNFVKAMGLCRGDLIALCDQDDIWKPEKLTVLEEVFQQDPSVSAAFSNADLIGAQSQPLNRLLWRSVGYSAGMQAKVEHGQALAVLQKMYFVTGATLMLRAEALTLLGDIPPDWVHDAWMSWRLATFGKLVGVPQPLIQYRVHTGNQIGIDGDLIAQVVKKRKRAQVLLTLGKEVHQLDELRNDLAFNFPEQDNAVQQTLRIVDRRLRYVRRRAALVASNKALRPVRILLAWRQYASFGKGWRTMLSDMSV